MSTPITSPSGLVSASPEHGPLDDENQETGQ